MNSHTPPDGETAQFLAKQEVVWKGFFNMISVAKFVTKGYLVSGPSEYLKEVTNITYNFATMTARENRRALSDIFRFVYL